MHRAGIAEIDASKNALFLTFMNSNPPAWTNTVLSAQDRQGCRGQRIPKPPVVLRGIY